MLRILQYYVQKFYGQIMALLFNKKNIADFDIIVLQKLWRNTYLNTTFRPWKDLFERAYMNDPLTQVCLYLNKKIALAS